MKGYPITFNIYAEDEQEALQAQEAVIAFITQHARQGRAVTGRKIAEALRSLDRNPFISSQITKYLQ